MLNQVVSKSLTRPAPPDLMLRRPQFSWTRIRGESDVTVGRGHGQVEAGEGSRVGADGGSPAGDRSRRRRGGGGVGGHWREDEARTSDRPPFQILSSDDLLEAARRIDRGEAVSLRGMPDARRARFARAADDALQLDESEWPARAPFRTRTRLTKDQSKHVAVLRQRRDLAAAELAIDAELIAPRAALERIAAEGNGGMDALLPWQQQLLRDRD